MAPQSNPDSLPAGADTALADSPSADDLMALVPDIELLETSETDARTAHTAVAAAAGSGRKPSSAPKLSDQHTATTVRLHAPKVAISDDPYADLMPELEAFEASGSGTRTIPELQSAPAPALKPPPATPRAAAPAAKAPVTAAARPVASPRPSAPPPAPANKAAAAPPKAPPTLRAAAPVDAKKLPNPENVAVPPVMDRDFIVRNRIVELYLSGSLPVRSATVFEKFCRQNPQILDEIGLPERVHTALRLLEASGKPEPWQEKPKRFWEQPYVLAALAGLALVLGVATLVADKRVSEQTHKAAALQQLVTSQPLDAATGTSTIYIQPTHSGPSSATAANIGGSAAQLVNIKIDMNHSDFRAFRITIDRPNQGRVAVLNNLIKDSNGALGFALNTSALGPDTYLLTIEGLDWRGDPQPDSWGAINIRH
jgi:hypothetical protein